MASLTTSAARRHIKVSDTSPAPLPDEARPLGPRRSHAAKLAVTARSLAILDFVAASPKPVDMLDVIGALQLPKATAYRQVEWFIKYGYLTREPDRRRLIVGPKLARLAVGALSASMRNAMPNVILQRLVRTVHETCNIGTLVNGEVVYLDRVEAEHWPLRLQFTSGSRVPLHCSAIGKLFLALSPPGRRKRLLQNIELTHYTEATITDRRQLEAELRQIRHEQVSFDREEYLAGVVCVAVPILRKNGEMIAALAVQAPEARLSVEQARQHLVPLREAAEQLGQIFETYE
jgi:IclR family transcriptional regulator, acetate operon repressor